MKLLLCNTYLYRKGGAEVSFFDLADLLTRKGHQVMFFGMKDPKNEVSRGSEYLVEGIEFSEYRPHRFLWNARTLSRVLYSQEAREKVRGLIQADRPDLVYVNNIAHHISPSIFDVFSEFRIPVLMAVRDYKIICPNSVLLNRSGVCEKCKGAKYYNVLVHRCKRNSLIPSAVACLEAYLHRYRRVYDSIDAFLAPSVFCKEKLIEFGLDADKIFVLPNFIAQNGLSNKGSSSPPFCVYFGRLSWEKGLYQLIEAASICREKVLIIGDGELKEDLVSRAERSGADNVTFMGKMDFDQLTYTVGRALFAVFPSLCYETFGRGILESFGLGKPVVASRIGALEELVENGRDGLLFKSGNARELAEKMRFMFSDPEAVSKMGARGREKAASRFTAEHHYEQLMSVLESVT